VFCSSAGPQPSPAARHEQRSDSHAECHRPSFCALELHGAACQDQGESTGFLGYYVASFCGCEIFIEPTAVGEGTVIRCIRLAYRPIILPVVLYGCETWSLTLREGCGLRVLRIFGPKRDGVIREWKKNTRVGTLTFWSRNFTFKF